MKFKSVQWLIPATLIFLSLVPVAGGSVRLLELSSHAEITADNARFFASPLPVILHIISVSLYSLLGAFQFYPKFRLQQPKWHRLSGRLLIPCGFMVALSGLWMTLFYPWPTYDGAVLYGMRLFVGLFMLWSLVQGVMAIRKRDFTQHGSWMIRAYAIGLGAGTQVFTHLPLILFPSLRGELTRTLCMAVGWIINLVIAEWLIHRYMSKPTRKPTVALSQVP